MGKARGGRDTPARSRRSAPNGADNSNGESAPFSFRSTLLAVHVPRHSGGDVEGGSDGAGLQTHRDKAILQEAVRDIRSGDARVKATAVRALGRLRNRLVVPVLVEAFEDASDIVRSECLSALAEIGEPSTVAVFKAALAHDESVRVRLAAVRGLYRLGCLESAPAIVKALQDEQASVRRRAALCLGWLGATEDSPSLLPLFRDEDPEVRAAAVEAVGALRFRSAIPGLIQALEDPDAQVRERANHALERITGRSCGTAPATRGDAYRKIAKKWQGWWSVG